MAPCLQLVLVHRSQGHINSASDLGRGISGRGRGSGTRGRSGRVIVGSEGHHHDAQNVSRNKPASAGTSPKKKVEGTRRVAKKVCTIDSVQVIRKIQGIVKWPSVLVVCFTQ